MSLFRIGNQIINLDQMTDCTFAPDESNVCRFKGDDAERIFNAICGQCFIGTNTGIPIDGS